MLWFDEKSLSKVYGIVVEKKNSHANKERRQNNTVIIGEIWGICGKPSDHNWDKANCMIQFKWKKISKHEISTVSIRRSASALKQTILHIGAQNYKGTSIVHSVYYLNLTYGISGEKFQVAVVTLKKVCK